MTTLERLVQVYSTTIPNETAGAWYIATPLAAETPDIEDTRIAELVELMPDFYCGFPNIIPLQPVICGAPLPNTFEPKRTWYGAGLDLLSLANGLFIIKQDGWEHSQGILLELGYARGKGIPITALTPEQIRERKNWNAH